jgi:hypothetical protein
MPGRRLAVLPLLALAALLASGWTYGDGMQPGSKYRARFDEAVSLQSPLFRTAMARLSPVTEVEASRACGPLVSCAWLFHPKDESRVMINGWRAHLQINPVHLRLPDPEGDFLIRHEIGHLVDFALIPGPVDRQFFALFRASPRWRDCFPLPDFARTIYARCVPPAEIFADQFAHWASRTDMTGTTVGYGVPKLVSDTAFANVLREVPFGALRARTG